MHVGSAAGIAGIAAWVFAALSQVFSGYSLTEIANIAATVKNGKREVKKQKNDLF